MKGIDAPVHLVHILRENTVILGTRGNAQLLTKIITKYTQDIFIYLFIIDRHNRSCDSNASAIKTNPPRNTRHNLYSMGCLQTGVYHTQDTLRMETARVKHKQE